MTNPTVGVLALILISLYSCNPAENRPREILTASDTFDDMRKYHVDFRLLSDSTFIFNLSSGEGSLEQKHTYSGRYFTQNDTIRLSPITLGFNNADKALLKDGFIEFLNGNRPLKMKVRETSLKSKTTYDTARFSDYAVFTYDSTFYRGFSDKARSIDLTTDELKLVDSILNVCLKENSIERELKDYYKQCVSVVEPNNEKVVWINLLCKGSSLGKTYKYYVVKVNDGGDCFLQLKINLGNLKYDELIVNGNG